MNERDATVFPTSSPLPPSPDKASLLDDFMDIFYAPSKVFARRINKGFVIPLLIMAVLTGLIFFANRDINEPVIEAEMARSMAQNPSGPQLTPEQRAASMKMVSTFGVVGAFVFTPVTLMIVGIVIWIVGKFFDSKQTLGAACTVAVFAFVPRIVEGVGQRVQALFVDTSTINSRYSLSLGPGRFLDADTVSPLLLAIVGRIDVFTIWVTILIGIGLAVTGKLSRTKAAIAAIVVWIVGGLPTIASALRG